MTYQWHSASLSSGFGDDDSSVPDVMYRPRSVWVSQRNMLRMDVMELVLVRKRWFVDQIVTLGQDVSPSLVNIFINASSLS